MSPCSRRCRHPTPYAIFMSLHVYIVKRGHGKKKMKVMVRAPPTAYAAARLFFARPPFRLSLRSARCSGGRAAPLRAFAMIPRRCRASLYLMLPGAPRKRVDVHVLPATENAATRRPRCRFTFRRLMSRIAVMPQRFCRCAKLCARRFFLRYVTGAEAARRGARPAARLAPCQRARAIQAPRPPGAQARHFTFRDRRPGAHRFASGRRRVDRRVKQRDVHRAPANMLISAAKTKIRRHYM